MAEFPSVFVSHGAPTILLEAASPARRFLGGLGENMGETLGRPSAVLCVTAHWETETPAVGAAPAPDTIHDFYGFPDILYEMRYTATGAPEVAALAAEALAAAGLDPAVDETRGLDHGTWVPLMLMYPRADVPVAQLSVQPDRGPRAHLELGRALAPLRDAGVLVLGSGGAVHNLDHFHMGPGATDPAPAPWAAAFEDWLVGRVEEGAADDMADYRTKCADGARAHPRDEHFLPLLVAMGAAMGAAGAGAQGRTLHRGFEHGSLSMAAFAFDGAGP